MSLTGKSSSSLAITITNDGFWPDLLMADLLNQYRIPAEYQDALVINETELAIISINRHCSALKERMIYTLSKNTLQDYCEAEDLEINGSFVLIKLYKRAVFCYAKAQLLQHFASINRRKIAENEAKESDETEQFWLDESQSAIAALVAHFYPDDQPLHVHGAHVALL